MKKIAEELFNEADMKRLNDRKKGLHLLTDLASFPPLQTTHFNENGSEEYKTEAQICVFGPSLIAILVVLYLYLTPLLFSDIIKTSINIENLDLGID